MRSKAMLFCALLWGMAIAVIAGCNRSGTAPDMTSALIELRDEGTIAWNIRADGTVDAMVKSRDDKPITTGITGKIATGDAPIELTQAEGSGVIQGKGLKLSGELTRAKYDLVVDGKTWNGTLFLPAGGTADLTAGAKAAAQVKLPEPKVGPHAGALQVVGGDVIELTANASTGELRAYVLDAELKAVAAADREIKVGIVSDSKAELVALVPEPGAAYFTAKMGINIDPIEVTISVKGKGQAQAQYALVGFQPGVAMAVGATAPRVKIMVKVDVAPPETDVNVAANVKGAAGVGANTKGAVGVKAAIAAPEVKANGTALAVPPQAAAGANANAGGAAKLGVGVGAGVTGGVSAGTKVGAETKADTKAATTDSKSTKAGAKLQVKLP